MIKSSLLNKEVIEERLTSLNTIKNTLICAGNGEIDKNDARVMESLISLVYIELELNDLKDNLPFIEIDLDKLQSV